MKNVLIILSSFLFIRSCNHQKIEKIKENYSSVKKIEKINNSPLYFILDFKHQNEINKNLEEINWDIVDEFPGNYIIDVLLIDGTSYKISIPLVGKNMPFHFKLNKFSNNTFNINATQQFNTIWTDSIIIKDRELKSIYRVSYRPNRTSHLLKIAAKDSIYTAIDTN